MVGLLQWLMLWMLSMISPVISWDDNHIDIVDDSSEDALVLKRVGEVIELQPAGMEFYVDSAKKVGGHTALGCAVGGLAGALLGSPGGLPVAALTAAKMCAWVSAAGGLAQMIDCPFSHWSKSVKAAYRARKAYKAGLTWLHIDDFELAGANIDRLVSKKFRKCALKYHADKIPSHANEAQRERALHKFANCKFAKYYIRKFVAKYGLLDPEDTGNEFKAFLQKFAGVWATRFGHHDRMTDAEVEEWINDIKHGEL